MSQVGTQIHCFHCGDPCEEQIPFDDHVFCCTGCCNVYEILSQNNLCDYYNLENTPGVSQRAPVAANRFNYLDDTAVQAKLIDYKDEQMTRSTFFIPVMHCASCIWLLEHLYKIEKGVLNSKVNFLKKTVTISYSTPDLTLRKLVEILTSLGYEPAINLNDIETQVKKSVNRRLSYQIGVAGFCFGNIMLISFPEYFGLDEFTRAAFSKLFGYLNFALSLPVFLFSAQDYFKNAYEGLRKRYVSIDVPLALGIFVLFFRSAYEIFSRTGVGYFDTHAGLVFFLLIGKWFQQKTFDTLSFERDYKSYFPVAVSVLRNGEETTVPVNALNIGDRMLIRNQELIPADSILLKGEAHIDFSFVTGESRPVDKVLGEVVYAGGRQIGQTLEMEVCKKVSQSYLTQLWNSDLFAKDIDSRMESFQATVSKYFTFVLLFVAFGSALFWLVVNPELSMNAFTSVLIIACPCALALSSPFALGTAMRLLGKDKTYLKAAQVVEQLAKTDAIVFDKTGTITQPGEAQMSWHGDVLTDTEKQMIYAVASQSMHPLSRRLRRDMIHHVSASGDMMNDGSASGDMMNDGSASGDMNNDGSASGDKINHGSTSGDMINHGSASGDMMNHVCTIDDFTEHTGRGSKAKLLGTTVMLGSAAWVDVHETNQIGNSTSVWVRIGDNIKGRFEFVHAYREGLQEVVNTLGKERSLYLLSGDNDSEKKDLTPVFGNSDRLHFNQSPMDKLNFIQSLQQQGKKVLMIGDGLNDAGALKAAHVGISITENTSHFSPASDVIMDASVFEKLPAILTFTKNTLTVIHMSFVISLLYNIIGLSYAVQGTLSPLIAAILMPLSSVTVIAFTTLVTTYFASRRKIG